MIPFKLTQEAATWLKEKLGFVFCAIIIILLLLILAMIYYAEAKEKRLRK